MQRSPLFAKLQAANARFMSHQGWEIPASFGSAGSPSDSVEAEDRALKEGAGLLDLSPRGLIAFGVLLSGAMYFTLRRKRYLGA